MSAFKLIVDCSVGRVFLSGRVSQSVVIRMLMSPKMSVVMSPQCSVQSRYWDPVVVDGATVVC